MSARCRVAILGFGTVGAALTRRLVAPESGAPSHIQLTHILDRRAAEKSGSVRAGGLVWTSSIDDILHSDADVVVELIGGVEPAAGWVRAALLAGKSVVTANKQVVARHGAALLTLAARQGRQVRFEAAVGGAMPIVRAIGEGLAGDRITRLVAILNGTTNAVLSRMEESGCTVEAALRAARDRGYAEADPAADLDGHDARAKLAILCGLAFGLRVDPAQIETRSSAAIAAGDFARARQHGATIRQIAYAGYDRAASALTAWVAPIDVDRGSIFGRTTGAHNAAVITGAHSGEIGIFGAGAGGDATAVAVLGDILTIARDKAAVVPAPVLSSAFTILNSKFLILNSVLAEAV